MKIRRFGVEDLDPVRPDILPSEALEGERREGERERERGGREGGREGGGE